MKLKNVKNIPAQIASELVSFKDEKREKITNKIISLLYLCFWKKHIRNNFGDTYFPCLQFHLIF